METIDIEVINWSRYNPRKDHKHPRWFAFSNDFFNDPKFYSFTHCEIAGWIYILCMASKENSAMVRLYFEHMQYATKATKDEITVLLKKLEKTQCIQVRVLGKYSTLHYNTIQNTNVQTAVRTSLTCSLDFDAAYKEYPRKVGRLAAEKSWNKIAPDAETQKSILMALAIQKKSDQWVKDNGAFIPHPSTWLNGHRWKDEVGPISIHDVIEIT